MNDTNVHLSHCNQGDYAGSCKYGDENCPTLVNPTMTRTPLRPAHLRKIADPAPLKNGDGVWVMLDEGFTCTGAGRTLLTYDAFQADWWFACESGRHFISGQLDFDKERFDGDGDYYVGIYLDD